ncbi:MAG: gluconokinase [Chitinophagaceae bacterium]|nr:gluconokinase [Chitinophagaceae bacterium]
MSFILGIDIGTSGAKAVAYSKDGKIIAHANSSYAVLPEEEGKHELDPEILFSAVLDVIKGTLKNTGAEKPMAISFSSAMHGLIAVDRSGKPITNMITWADLRSSKYATQLNYSPQAEIIYGRTGTPIHPMSPLCKIIWLRNELPEIFSAAYKFISIKELIFYRFFGEYIIDYSIASATGLLDIYELNWNKTALDAAGIEAEKLSRPVPSTYIIKELKPEYASQTGIEAGTPFVIGASDGCLAHIGSNAIKPNDVSLTIGTSGAVRLMSHRPFKDIKKRIFNYILDEGLYISGGPTNNGGNILQWFAANFLRTPFKEPGDFDEFINEALEISAGAGGIIFLPYIFGERAPVWNAEAEGLFYGINSTHTVNHFMRALMEGIAFGLYEILNILEEINGPVNDIYVSGGFIKSRKWVSLLADVFGRKMHLTNAEDSSAAGAAMIGLKALGVIKDYSEAASFFTLKETFDPNMQNHEACKKNFNIYVKLYKQLKDIKK